MKAVNKNTSPEIASTDMITWSGPDIQCLNICTGQNLSTSLYSIATKLCDVLSPTDLSTLSLQGVYEFLSREEIGDRTLLSVFQLLVDGELFLDQRIINLEAKVDGISQSSLVLDLKCLKQIDGFGNQLPYTSQTVLQTLVNGHCTQETQIADLSGKLISLQNQVDDIDIPDGEEKSVNTCVSGLKPISQALIDVSSDYCGYKDVVGSASAIQINMSKLDPNIATLYNTTQGWVLSPARLAEAFGNALLIINNLATRILSIETNCCKTTCSDIVIEMLLSPTEDGTGVNISFPTSIGTIIPSGFVDGGSRLTISDVNDKKVEYPIVVSENGTQGTYSFSGLDTTKPLTASVAAKLNSDALGCEKCISKQFDAQSGCPVCAITATGTTGSVTIIYQTKTLS